MSRSLLRQVRLQDLFDRRRDEDMHCRRRCNRVIQESKMDILVTNVPKHSTATAISLGTREKGVELNVDHR